ncbi:MAG: hypothetical protein GEU99_10825 [Luteitalea sp.]|nr:hypothetical protein [Luteitalea sp.]
MLRFRQERRVVLVGQVRCEEPNRGERDRPRGELREDRREAAGGPRDFYPVVRGVLRETQHLRAVREERGTAFGQIEAPGIERGEGGDEARGRIAFAGSEAGHLAEQILIGEVIERGKRRRHISLYGRDFRVSEHARRARTRRDPRRMSPARLQAAGTPG